MGMDVYGKKPTAPEGEYFRNSVWSWRPLAHYITGNAPEEITNRCRHWQTNDGAGLDASGAVQLADWLDAELSAGRTAAFERDYRAAQDALPDEACTICAGTGKRLPPPVCGPGDVPCNGCDAKGHKRPSATWYPFATENVAEFSRFCRASGGFKIC